MAKGVCITSHGFLSNLVCEHAIERDFNLECGLKTKHVTEIKNIFLKIGWIKIA